MSHFVVHIYSYLILIIERLRAFPFWKKDRKLPLYMTIDYYKLILVNYVNENSIHFILTVILLLLSSSTWCLNHFLLSLQSGYYKAQLLEHFILSQLKQSKMEFPLGTVMNAERIVDTEDASNLAYQQVFYDNFEWGVLGNALKWKQMQPRKVSIHTH